MSNILATNPRLEDLIRKQVNEYGLNHGRISDNQGMIMDSNGNTTNYRGSNGRHPNAKINKNNLYEDCGGTYEEEWEMDEDCGRKHELQEELPCGVFTKCRWERIKKAVNDAIDEVGGAFGGGARPSDDPSIAGYSQNLEMGEATSSGGASGSYVAPLDFDETEEIIEGVMRDEVNKIINEQQEELHEMPTCYSWCYGHGGWCEGKYGPCNIPDRGSFDSVADIPKGGVKGDDQHIVHGKGSGFKTPQGGSERLETFNRRQMKESLKNRVIDRILNESKMELQEKEMCWYRRSFRGGFNGCMRKACGGSYGGGGATTFEAMAHCDDN